MRTQTCADALWHFMPHADSAVCLQHSEADVRAAAAAALAQYPAEVLHELGMTSVWSTAAQVCPLCAGTAGGKQICMRKRASFFRHRCSCVHHLVKRAHSCAHQAMQLVVEAGSAEDTTAYETLALRGVVDEHARRRSLLSRRALVEGAGTDGPGTQLRQLQRRVATLLPGKLRAKMPQHGCGAARLELLACEEEQPDGEVLSAAQSALRETAFSATPFLDGAAPVELAADMWHAYLLRCDIGAEFKVRCHTSDTLQASMCEHMDAQEASPG